MFDSDRFFAALKKGEVPEVYPSECKHDPLCRFCGVESFVVQESLRHEYGMYGMVTKLLCEELVAWIGKSKVLEIMAGVGWFAKGLTEQGVDVVATDNGSWSKIYPKWKKVFGVKNLGALAAVRRHRDECDVLFLSWPHFLDVNHVRAVKEWPAGKRVVYVGENEGGCCARDEFFGLVDFKRTDFTYHTFPGLHDYVMAGVRVDAKV